MFNRSVVCNIRAFSCARAALAPKKAPPVFENRTTSSSQQPKSNRFASKYSKGQGSTQPHGKKPSRSNNHQAKTKTLKFRFDSGSEKAKDALKDLIKRVHAYGTNYQVNLVDPQSNKLKKTHLVEVANSTDLNTTGFHVVGPLSPGELPLVKLIKVQEMLKDYSDKLALAKERELLELGSSVAKRVINKRMQAEKKKSATKMLALSWSISVSDLMHQKKNEIMKRVANNEKFIIFVGERESLYGARNSVEKEDGLASQLGTSRTKWDRMDEDQLAIEMKKREMIFGKLEDLLKECECKYDVSGTLDARMMLNVSPKPNAARVEEKEHQVSVKESRRERKAAKNKPEPAKKKIDDDDLDSLYLIKIME